MKIKTINLLAIVLALCLFNLSLNVLAAPKNKLNLFIWSEYIDPEIVSAFEKKFDCKVTIDLYEDNESMIAKLAGGGDSLYDLIVPSDYALSVLSNRGLLRTIDKAKIPNFANLDPKFIDQDFDPKNKYSVPYQWGTVGIYLRKKPDQNIDESWSLVFDPNKQPGPFVIIDSMREAISAALLYAGHGVNETDPEKLKAARDLLLDAKNRSIGMDGGVGGKNKVLANNATMAVVYNGDALRGMEEDPETYYFVPKEGGELWIDSLAIPAKSPNLDMAYKFINYILDAEVGAQLSNFNQYGTPNKASLSKIDPEDLKNPAIYPPEEVMKKLQTLKDLGDKTKLYDEIWTQIKG
jgi:spermidine/putrescine transport system substrate-binding protein